MIFEWKQGLIWIHFELVYEGNRVKIDNCILDTGSATTAIDIDLIDFNYRKPSKIKRLFGIGGGTREVIAQKIDKAIIDKVELKDIEIEFGDIKAELGINGMICVDTSLAENQNEGRLCFTFAHEAGHWVLHREHINRACRTGTDDAFIFCRIKDAKQKIEWQADYFASNLLMPKEAVKSAFYKCYGSRPLILYNVKSAFCGPICFDPCVENWPKIAGAVKEASGFSNVSKQAMIIRLQDLGLVRNETRAGLSWAESYSFS